jgi:hypothetical protein
MGQFYSYLWLREDGTPYYAGKGSGRRAFIRRENHWPPKDPTRIALFPQDSEADAFESEIALIALFGRKDIGTGILQNRTTGGENPPRAKKGRKYSPEGLKSIQKVNSARLLGKRGMGTPHFGFSHSAETRRKMSQPRLHSWTLSEETKRQQSAAAVLREAKKKEQGIHCGQVFGYRHTEEAKRKISEAKKGKPSWNKGIPQTSDHIAKLSAARKGKKRGPYRKRDSNGELQFNSKRQHDDYASSNVGPTPSA